MIRKTTLLALACTVVGCSATNGNTANSVRASTQYDDYGAALTSGGRAHVMPAMLPGTPPKSRTARREWR